MLTTNQKGAAAETAIAHEAIKLGLGVWLPLADEPCDLILDLRPRLLRVQCKWARREGNVVSIRTRRCRRGREGLIHRQYGAEEIDAIGAYCPDTDACYLLPHELSVNRAGVLLRLERTRNNQHTGIRWARDFEFRATLARILGP
jgi:PD-(D/E)XK nuclease superfamily protein